MLTLVLKHEITRILYSVTKESITYLPKVQLSEPEPELNASPNWKYKMGKNIYPIKIRL